MRTSKIVLRIVVLTSCLLLVGVVLFVLTRPSANPANDAPIEVPASEPSRTSSAPDDGGAPVEPANVTAPAVEQVTETTRPADLHTEAEYAANGFRRVEWRAIRKDDRRPVNCTVEGFDAAGAAVMIPVFASGRSVIPSTVGPGGTMFIAPSTAMLRFRPTSQWDLAEARVPVPTSNGMLEVELEAGTGMVTGQVVDETGTGLADVVVQMSIPLHRSTDANGFFTFSPLADGSFSLSVKSDGLAPAATASATVVVKGGRQDAPVVLMVVRGATVRGHVLEAGENHPIANARLVLSKPGDEKNHRTAVASDEGAFQFSRLVAGDYVVAAWTEDGTYGRTLVSVPKVNVGEERDVTIRLSAGAGTIRGHLVDDHGKPVPFGMIAAVNAAGSTLTARTGSDGAFEMTRVPAGNWKLSPDPRYCEAFNWTAGPAAPVVVASGGEQSVELTVRAGVVLRGIVESQSGRKALKVRLTPDGGAAVDKTVGREGAFAFSALATGSYLVEVLDPAAQDRPLAQQRVFVDERGARVKLSVP